VELKGQIPRVLTVILASDTREDLMRTYTMYMYCRHVCNIYKYQSAYLSVLNAHDLSVLKTNFKKGDTFLLMNFIVFCQHDVSTLLCLHQV
jgi:hypothetical protein